MRIYGREANGDSCGVAGGFAMHIVLLLYLIEGVVFGILAFVLKKKRSNYPDFTVGYHDSRLMDSAEKWNYANHLAGNLSGIFAAVFFAVSALLYCAKTSNAKALVLFFILSAIAIGGTLLLPIWLSKLKFGDPNGSMKRH